MASAGTHSPTRVRYLVALMLFITVVINYLDRNNISTTVVAMKAEFGIGNVEMGWVLAGFGWTYAFFQIPGGWLVDRMTPRVFYPILLVLWSLATLGMSLVSTVAGLFVLRALVGMLEAPSYSINNQVASSWFPNKERASVVGFFISAQFIGPAFLTGLLIWLEHTYGWRSVFYVTGAAGLAWGILWWFVYRGPRESRLANAAEIAEIKEGGALVDFGAADRKMPAKFKLDDFITVFKYKKLWGVYLGQFAITSSQYFFLLWFPTYLVEYRGLTDFKTGLYASIPFMGAFFGALCSGFISDKMLRSGFTIGTARKTPIIAGLLISSVVVMANYVESTEIAIVFFTIALFGNGLASIGWSLISTVAPQRLIGLTGGTFNGISNLSGIVTPMVIGYLAANGNFAPGLVYISVVALLGVCSYVFLIGKLESVEP
jgi:ACS family D-galactonate transporter-like MFS transporter